MRQWKLIGPERAIGRVVDPAYELIAPGVIEHRELRRFTLGEPDGSRSKRIVAHGGLEPPPTKRLRRVLLHLSYSMTLSRLLDTTPPAFPLNPAAEDGPQSHRPKSA
jgi:hypothetical protein